MISETSYFLSFQPPMLMRLLCDELFAFKVLPSIRVIKVVNHINKKGLIAEPFFIYSN
jgi:hypothetical protein